jgi:hypothetical protein
MKPTKKAKQFMKANAESVVVAGAAREQGGGTYTLRDGRSFSLSLEDMRSMPMPDWGFDAPNVIYRANK